jgi:hypothetical protein
VCFFSAKYEKKAPAIPSSINYGAKFLKWKMKNSDRRIADFLRKKNNFFFPQKESKRFFLFFFYDKRFSVIEKKII